MKKKKSNKPKKSKDPNPNKNLPGFDIHINSFGEVQSTYEIDDVNAFLDDRLESKKLKKKAKDKKTENDDAEEVK